MRPLPPEIKELFFKTIKGDVSVEEFEQWLYADETLESLLDPDDYLELISFNYKRSGAKYELSGMLKRQINLGEYHTFKILSLLKELRGENARFLVNEIDDLCCKGYRFLYDVGLDYYYFYELDAQQKIGLQNSVQAKFASEIDRIISSIESGKIIITGDEDEFGHFVYDDYRTEDEIY